MYDTTMSVSVTLYALQSRNILLPSHFQLNLKVPENEHKLQSTSTYIQFQTPASSMMSSARRLLFEMRRVSWHRIDSF